MPSSATSRLRLEKQGSGENGNTWGEKLNDVLDRLDESFGAVSFTLSGPKTLSPTDYDANESRALYLNITGGTGGTITIPNVDKPYLVRNNTSGDVVLTTGSGTTATVPVGSVQWVMSEGSNVVRSIMAKATAAEIHALVAGKVLYADAVGDACAPVTLTYSATPAIDWNDGYYRTLTLTGNCTPTFPTNVKAGTTRVFYVVGNNGTARTLDLTATGFKGDTRTFSDITSSKGYLITLFGVSSSQVAVVGVRAL